MVMKIVENRYTLISSLQNGTLYLNLVDSATHIRKFQSPKLDMHNIIIVTNIRNICHQKEPFSCVYYGLPYAKFSPPSSLSRRTYHPSVSKASRVMLIKSIFHGTAPSPSVEELVRLRIHADIRLRPHSWKPTVDTFFVI